MRVPKPKPTKKKPRSPLVRTSVLKRSPLKHKRGAPKRFAKKRNPEYVAYIRSLPCLLMGRPWLLPLLPITAGTHLRTHVCQDRVVVMHVKSRGAGAPDVGATIPACDGSHKYSHEIGIKTWAAGWFPGGLAELKRIAAEIYPKQWERAKVLGWEAE